MIIRALLMAMLLAGPAPAQDRFQRGTMPWNGKVEARGDALLKANMLAAHNGARREYGSPALTWDETLATAAMAYARRLAATNSFAHDPQRGVDPPQGENLYMGTRGAFSYAAMAKLWVDERRDFRAGRFPDVVKSGHWSRVGHYTQVVWPTTQRFGCALATSARDDFLVCRYLPAGNYFGTLLR